MIPLLIIAALGILALGIFIGTTIRLGNPTEHAIDADFTDTTDRRPLDILA